MQPTLSAGKKGTAVQYEVRALNPAVGIVLLRVDAPDVDAATRQVREQGAVVLSARALGLSIARRRWKRSRFPVLQFSQELAALLQAGLSLPETLDVMMEKEHRADVKAVLAALHVPLMEGRSFSQALAERPQDFPPLFIATIQASERTGDISESLLRYIDYHERLDIVRKTIVAAAIYPLVLLGVGLLVVLFLLGYVVPRFSAIYAEGGRDLPWLSRLLLQWGTAINEHGSLVAGFTVALVAATAVFFRPLIRSARRAIARVPAIGSRLSTYHLARLYRTVSMLLKGGTPIVPALEMVSGLLPIDMRSALALAIARLREGVAISDALREAGLTTAIANRMLKVGERSGDMARMMDRIAAFHDEELGRWTVWFTKLLEPLLMAVIGVVIGGIVVLMYMPIFELAGSLQ
jgi:general secretion pathway protein F